MKSRALWFLVAVAALVIVAIWWWRASTPSAPPAPKSAVVNPAMSTATAAPSPRIVVPVPPKPPANVVSPTPPAPVAQVAVEPVPATAKPNPDVAIEDGKTIDFSGGAPQTKNDADEQASIARAVKEMQEATKNVTFGPSAPAPSANKKAEPPVAPPSH